MHVLLINIHRSPRALAGYYASAWAPMPPISLAYLAAALEQAGIEVSVYDDHVGRGDGARLEAAIRAAAPDLVGLSVVTAVAAELPRVTAAVRAAAPKSRIVAGNIHAQIYHAALLEAGLVDYVVHGEGEVTLVELARALARPGDDAAHVAGLSFWRDGHIVETPARPPVEDLDTLPFPAWHKFPMHAYRLLGFARVRDPGSLILGSRGCPYRCTYCSLAAMTSTRRCRSAVNIADEFEWLLARHGVRQPSFVDPIFPFDRKEALDFSAELIRRGLHKEQVWVTETRTDRVDLEMLQAMREAGLRRIMFGLEAADADALLRLRKGALADDAVRAVDDCRRAGVEVIGFFMLGVPGATRASMRRDMAYARRLDLDYVKHTVFVPYPGTPIWRELHAQGELLAPEDWARYTSYPTFSNPPVYLTKGLSTRDLIAAQAWAHASFYLRPRWLLRHAFGSRRP